MLEPDQYTTGQNLRTQAFLNRVNRGERKNAQGWANEFGVSSKTFQRDLKYIRGEMEIDVQCDRSNGGVYYLPEKLPKDAFAPRSASEKELFAICVAHKAISQYSGTSFEAPLRQAFAKLMNRLDEDEDLTIEGWSEIFSFRPFAGNESDPKVFDALIQAIKKRLTIRLQYRGSKDKEHLDRELEPHHLFFRLGSWYLIAFDRPTGQLKTFSLRRMREVKPTATSFERQDNDILAHLRDSFGVSDASEPVKVVLRFTAEVSAIVRERQWHHSQKIEHLVDGGLQLSMWVAESPYLVSWILGWGPAALVLEPDSLRHRVREQANQTAALYP